MPERKHNLPDSYDRLDDQITGDMADSIVIHPRSHGHLRMPGEYSTDNGPPGRRVKITSTATDNQGVHAEERLLGGPEHYLVTYEVWNYRDSQSFARLILTGQADDGAEDDPEG
jgi:hypothetical protein